MLFLPQKQIQIQSCPMNSHNWNLPAWLPVRTKILKTSSKKQKQVTEGDYIISELFSTIDSTDSLIILKDLGVCQYYSYFL